jgi:hypothetical protein
VLIAAETWGCPPWEIAEGDKVTWYMRWRFFQGQRIKREEIEADDLKEQYGFNA